MAETIVSKVQRGAKLESRGAKHPLAPPQNRLCIPHSKKRINAYLQKQKKFFESSSPVQQSSSVVVAIHPKSSYNLGAYNH